MRFGFYVFLISIASILITRLIPHPPNFTSLIAISFYIPILFGRKYIFLVLIAFIISDLLIGFHPFVFWTWFTTFIIGLIGKNFIGTLSRMSGSLLGAIIFFIISNFGVWINGQYGYSISGVITCYYLALPFFTNTLISTVLYSLLIDVLITYKDFQNRIKLINPSFNK